MKKLDINFYLPKSVTDDEIDLVKTYGDLYDNNGWSISDCKQYHLLHKVGQMVSGYGFEYIKNMIAKGEIIKELSFDEFAVMTGYRQPKEEPKEESSNLPNNKLTIKNIEKVLLKYIGEQESDDIIKELKQLS